MAVSEIIMMIASALFGGVVTIVVTNALKNDEKREKQRAARDAVAMQIRRIMALIDGLDTYVRIGLKPGLEHVKMVRGVVAERDSMNEQLQQIGDSKLEREVREWFRLIEGSLKFEQDYVSGDPEAPARYGHGPEKWEQLWEQRYAVHSSHIIVADRLAKALEPPKKQPKPRRPKVPGAAMMPPIGGRAAAVRDTEENSVGGEGR